MTSAAAANALPHPHDADRSRPRPSRRIAFLGAGNMNGAILRGILAAGADPSALVATVRGAEKARALRTETGIEVLAGADTPDANRAAAAGADIVFLGVKPVGIQDLCREIAGALRPDAVVVSVAAGVTIAQIEGALAAGQPVVRSMPNTPLMAGRGAVGLSAGSTATEAQVAEVVALFEVSGLVRVVPEEQLDAVTAISGSGPAYAFYLAEAMARAGVELGLSADLARDLARATVAGAGAMLADPAADPAGLRKAITSPNGTTERALAAFDEAGLADIVARGARAAAERAAEISRSLG
ncbi:pyrroline-5-carboxylate reductase [Zafaria cholistanensis]|uniref:Pyrroline-5-carboxylate reductase n=1 Tax=Zafaria cholistanensis TaxID=1682741 RepID=A0A5A7NR51_9MICC|nr:pyrroline-5-carboxylate reductase [Zafaria cholistanensis]GER22457.1 pyrroline-5-carboxylate reductase [Zafaria cholistanensis]